MKIGYCILTIWLAASAWAQTSAAKPPATPAKPTAARKMGATATPRQAAKPQAGKLSADKAVSTAAAKGSEAGSAKKTDSAKKGRKGGRDPFVSPIVERSAKTQPACSGTGKHCLYTGQVILQGVVESDNGVLAVVVSGGRTYFLREHDMLADGEVEKITKTGMTLRQRSTDIAGRPIVREITRKLTPAV